MPIYKRSKLSLRRRTYKKKNAAKGRGLYMSAGAQGRGAYRLGKNIGSSLGRLVGLRKAGGSIGSRIENLLNKTMQNEGGAVQMAGHGLYHSNSLIRKNGTQMFDGVPSFSSKKDETGALSIQHREFITDVFGNQVQSGNPNATIPFSNIAYSLNPGLESTFPWLSQIAQNYEEYEFKSLIYTYKSVIADVGYSTSGQIGTVIMATNYNATQEPFEDKQIMMEYDAACSTKCSQSMLHGVECHPAKLSGHPGKYVRTAPVQVGEDVKTYDHGKFQIAFANTPTSLANQTLGELWVSYDITLRKPKFFSGRGKGITRGIWCSSNEQLSLPMGATTDILRGQQNTMYCAIATSANAGSPYIDVTFPASYAGNVRFIMCIEMPATTDNIPGYGAVLQGNVTVYDDLYGCSVGGNAPNSSVACQQLGKSIFVFDLKVQQASNAIDNKVRVTFVSNFTVPPNQVFIDITEYNANFSNTQYSATPVLVNVQNTVVAA